MAQSSLQIQLAIDQWDLSPDHSNSVPNGCILKLFVERKSLVAVRRGLESHVGFDIDDNLFRSHFTILRKAYDNVKKVLKNEKVWTDFLALLKSEWTVIRKRDIIPKKNHNLCSRVPSPPPPPIKRLRTDCSRCALLQKNVDDLEAKLTELKVSNNSQLNALNKEKCELSYELKKLKQKVDRRDKTIKSIRTKKNNALAKLKLRSRDPMDLSRLLKNERIRFAAREKQLSKHLKTIKTLEQEVNGLNKEIINYERCVDDLVCSGEEVSSCEEEGRGPGLYNFKIRKVLYQSLQSKVPLAHAGDLINSTLLELCNLSTPMKLPSKATIARMVYELSALATLQATEAFLLCDAATLCWDATTIDGHHLNEVHVETVSQNFTLSIACLPGGSAVDYTLHLTQTIDRMAHIHAKYTNTDPITVKDMIIEKVCSTKSDRCPVNGSVTRQLRDLWKKDLVELHCNLHPLDGFSKSICTALKKMDAEMEMPSTGRDCCASNFLYTLSKIRNKATGDPAGITAFLHKHGISPAEIPRFVGNRWNLLFKMSHTVIQRQDLIQEYLERFCKKEEMRKDLLWGILDPRLIAQFRALALVGEVITGPWMTLFYSNKARLSNLEMVPHLKTFMTKLDDFSVDSKSILTTTTDIFNQPLDTSSMLAKLQSTPPEDIFLGYITLMVNAIQKVARNQLTRYVTGELSHVTPDMLKATQASSPHNVWAERVLGTYDSLWRRGKQATTNHVEVKVQCTTNNTLTWLGNHAEPIQQSLIKFAVTMGGIFRKEELQRRKWLRGEAHQRLIEVGQKRDEKKRRAFEKEIADALKGAGGDGVERLEGFVELGERAKGVVRAIASKKCLKGVEFFHDWEEEDGSTEKYRGCVLSQSKRSNGLMCYKVRYVLPGFEETPSIDPLMSEKMVCDLLLGDLKMLDF